MVGENPCRFHVTMETDSKVKTEIGVEALFKSDGADIELTENSTTQQLKKQENQVFPP